MATATINGVQVTMELGEMESQGEDGGWRNGIVTLPDGRQFSVGGGWIHSAQSALHENRCHGLQTDTHPELQWPGSVDAGDFAAYEGHDNGDLDGLAEAVGLEKDQSSYSGRENWNKFVEAIQSLSRKANRE